MPDSWLAVIWEQIVLAVLLIVCFVYTFVSTFSISLHALGYADNVPMNILLCFTYLLDAVLVADFIMRFNMASVMITGDDIDSCWTDFFFFQRKKIWSVRVAIAWPGKFRLVFPKTSILSIQKNDLHWRFLTTRNQGRTMWQLLNGCFLRSWQPFLYMSEESWLLNSVFPFPSLRT